MARFASRRTSTAALLLIAFAAGLTRRVEACSICRCGDPTFSALGPSIYTAGAFRLAIDWDRFDKENATSGEAAGAARFPGLRRGLASEIGGRDEEVENRVTATLSYSFGERVNAVVRLPWSTRHLIETEPDGARTVTDTNGFSDPEVYALVKLWASPLASGVGRRAWVSLLGGVKMPWGRNDLTHGGERLDEHAQPGTGATDVFGGVSAFYILDPRSSLFASVQLRSTGRNDSGYRYGDSALANAAYERKLSERVDSLLELNYRHAQKDRVDASDAVDPNTGGDVLYLTPRALVSIARGLVGRVSVQLPIVKSLYGDQTERVVVNAGFTYLF